MRNISFEITRKKNLLIHSVLQNKTLVLRVLLLQPTKF
jgi:hypothetical protein